MKKLLLFSVVLLGSLLASAQPTPSEARVKFIDKEKRAASFEVPYSSEIVEKAIEDRMARKGSRPESVRGYTLYRGVKLHDGSSERADFYFKVDRKSRRDKNSSMVYVFAVNPNDNAHSAETTDTHVEASKEFLGTLIPAIEAKDVDNNIASQSNEISVAEKKLKKLQDDYAELEKKMKALTDKMDENKRNQDLQTAEIEKLKAFLDAIKEKKGS